MKIGLIDVDGHNFVNLALMKIARYYHGSVEWAMPLFGKYDTIFASKIFTFSPETNWNEYSFRTLEKGGTGYDIKKKLPPLLKIYYNQIIASIQSATTLFSSIHAVASVTALSAWCMTRKVVSSQLSRWN